MPVSQRRDQAGDEPLNTRIQMKFALQEMPDGQTRIVDASGKPLGTGDADRPLLHVLPKLFVPQEMLGRMGDSYRGLHCEEIELGVKTSLDLDILPEGGIKIRQPYPNRRYFVGGSDMIRNGWLVPLPMDVTEFDIEFSWHLEGPGLWNTILQDDWWVRHQIHIKLLPGRGLTYSMDSACWPRVKGIALPYSPISNVGYDEHSKVGREHRQIVTESILVYKDEGEDGTLAGYFIEEKVDIVGVPLDQAWSIDAFQDEQLHEVEQTALLNQENEQHRQNGPIEMPSHLLVEAISLARTVKYGKGSKFFKSTVGVPGRMEQHPAMKLLCDWWSSVRQPGEPFLPGSAMPLVRVRDDGQYWWGHHEIPNVSVSGFNKSGLDAVRVGDQVLVLFHATQDSATFGEEGMSIPLPSGTPGTTIGVNKSEYLNGDVDEAWQCVEALRLFPDRFPAAWNFLNKEGNEYRRTERLKVERQAPLPEGIGNCSVCGQLPILTEDPTNNGRGRFILKCGDHTVISGETVEEIVTDWNYEDFDPGPDDPDA
jgi:hypothetical protein